MTVTTWPANVNKKFYAFNSHPKDNAIVTENISGRTVGYNANTRNVFVIDCSITLKVKTELPTFWNWFTSELGGLTGGFICDALGDKVYRFVSVPSPSDTDLQYRELNLEIEEVY